MEEKKEESYEEHLISLAETLPRDPPILVIPKIIDKNRNSVEFELEMDNDERESYNRFHMENKDNTKKANIDCYSVAKMITFETERQHHSLKRIRQLEKNC